MVYECCAQVGVSELTWSIDPSLCNDGYNLSFNVGRDVGDAESVCDGKVTATLTGKAHSEDSNLHGFYLLTSTLCLKPPLNNPINETLLNCTVLSAKSEVLTTRIALSGK